LSDHAAKTKIPEGIQSLFWFFFFNFLSCQIIMDSPVFLYTERLGASATVMGLIAGMTPLMVIFQIPAAAHVGRWGYKRLITIGWSLRLIFVFGLVFVPLLDGRINQQSQLALVLMLLFAFNVVRGIASCAWYPWIRGLIPESIRGRYLTIEGAFVNAGSLVAFLLVAAYLGQTPTSGQFSFLFGFSCLAGVCSIYFILRVPAVAPPSEEVGRKQKAPWAEIFGNRSFRKLLWVELFMAIALGGLAAFTVKYLKAEAGMQDNHIMLASAAKFVGALGTLWFLKSRLDRMGSRPIIFFGLAIGLVCVVVFGLIAGRVMPLDFFAVAGLYLSFGFVLASVTMSMSRLAMATVPRLGSSHYFAVFAVVGNLGMGVSPTLWGVMIDILSGRKWDWLGIEWNEYTIYFSGVAVVLMLTALATMRLEEPKAARLNEFLIDLIRHSPLRYWMRS
jgi:MFS family permease